MALEDDVVVEDIPLSDDEIKQLDDDFASLGEPTEKKEVVEEKLTPEEEEDKQEDELHSDKSPEEREAIRERRRLERKQKVEYRKQKEDSYRREIETLRRQLDEVNSWKNTVEKRNVQSGIAQIDKAINDANEALNLSRQAMAQATRDNDGQAQVDATELYYAARKRAEDLNNVKQTIAKRMSQRPQQTLDPGIVQNAQRWIESKPWYDVTGKDEDSRVTQSIEGGMASQGWDPRQPEYWKELDTRLQKYLPHRFNTSYTGSNTSTKGEKPRPPTESSSQGATKPTSGYRLSPERVKAMKDAGVWDDPSARREMIKSYIDYDKQSKG
jgi:hypothetical protein